MKDYNECKEWFRKRNLLNRFCRNMGHHSDEYTPSTLKEEVENNGENLIINAFTWTYDTSINWVDVHTDFLRWYNS